MEKPHDCPLSPSQLALLKACAHHETTATKRLATLLGLSPNTIDGKFKQILARLETESRGMALIRAQQKGWIATNSSPEPNDASDM